MRRFFGWQTRENGANFLVFDAPRQTIAAKQINIADGDRMRPFQVDLDSSVGAEGAGDDVFRHDGRDVGVFRQLSGGTQLPLQTVIKRELADIVLTKTINATVADVASDRTLR